MSARSAAESKRDSLKAQLDDLKTAKDASDHDLGIARSENAVLRYQLSLPARTVSACQSESVSPRPPALRRTCVVSGTDPNGWGWIALRYAPNSKSKWSTTHLTEGMQLRVIGEEGDYSRVRVGNEEGFAATKYLKCE